ncbi:MAG TPA: alcohol dehydrogenase catalytic domain-containing protein [Vicinamibacterales bacterium]|nr:alcohol dehydrogenase catalytic domain-containing protein [Vicinamibacterales bacterium]
MRALVLDDQVNLIASRPTPTPAAGEVLVRVIRAGVCETDLQLIKGYMGFRGVLGHEFVGVAESGPLAGRRVVGEINCACWNCETCRMGLPTHCPNRTVLGILNHDGAFADVIAVPQRNLHAVPDALSDDVAVFTEPVAAAYQIPAQLTIRAADRIVVLGDGRLGNLCAQVLARLSDRVLVVGKHPEKLSILSAMGVATALLSDALDPRSFDVVVDCTGSESGLPTALKLVRPRGTIVLKTTVAGQQTLAWAPFVIDEVTLIGSRCGPFDQALTALEQGHVNVQPLISDRFDLSHGLDALARAQTKGILKVLLDVG